MSIIETDNLTRSYGRRRGIEEVSLAVPEGALFGFLGPNGAGKTTTIRVLLGLLRPTSGAARLFGLDCWRDSHRVKRDLGYLPGDLRLPPWFTGRAALSIFGRVRGEDLMPHGRTLADRFELDLAVRVRAMSRGMRQKLGLILALAHRPKVLILDEPTSGLDPLMQDLLRSDLKRLAAEGHTIFFSSHQLGEVEQLCDRVAIVREGRIVMDETLDALRTRAGHEVVIRWRHDAKTAGLETPPMLEVDRREAGEWHGRLEGEVRPLLEWLGRQPVADVSIGRPDLETLFAHFYGGKERSP